MKYQLIEADSGINLQVLMESAIKDGWVPQGGVAAWGYVDGDGVYQLLYFQALIKNEVPAPATGEIYPETLEDL